MRGRELRIVFGLGLAWATWYFILWAFTRLSHDQLDRPYSPVLDWLSIPAAVLVGLSLTGILVRLWPTFLNVPDSVSRPRLLGRLLVYAPLLLMALVVLFVVVAGLNEWLTGDPQDTWCGTSIFFAAMWYPLLLTPAVTFNHCPLSV
jgi:hypothetical protein